MIEVRVQEERIDIAVETARLAGVHEAAGAVATFVGQVRGGGGIEAIELEAHPELTGRAIAAIAEHAESRWNLAQASIVHRVGRMQVGEPIVFVAAAAAHRREALDACAYMIDTLKTQAPFWKKEYGDGFERWVEPSAEDHAAAAGWLEKKDAPCHTT